MTSLGFSSTDIRFPEDDSRSVEPTCFHWINTHIQVPMHNRVLICDAPRFPWYLVNWFYTHSDTGGRFAKDHVFKEDGGKPWPFGRGFVKFNCHFVHQRVIYIVVDEKGFAVDKDYFKLPAGAKVVYDHTIFQEPIPNKLRSSSKPNLKTIDESPNNEALSDTAENSNNVVSLVPNHVNIWSGRVRSRHAMMLSLGRHKDPTIFDDFVEHPYDYDDYVPYIEKKNLEKKKSERKISSKGGQSFRSSSKIKPTAIETDTNPSSPNLSSGGHSFVIEDLASKFGNPLFSGDRFAGSFVADCDNSSTGNDTLDDKSVVSSDFFMTNTLTATDVIDNSDTRSLLSLDAKFSKLSLNEQDFVANYHVQAVKTTPEDTFLPGSIASTNSIFLTNSDIYDPVDDPGCHKLFEIKPLAQSEKCMAINSIDWVDRNLLEAKNYNGSIMNQLDFGKESVRAKAAREKDETTYNRLRNVGKNRKKNCYDKSIDEINKEWLVRKELYREKYGPAYGMKVKADRDDKRKKKDNIKKKKF